MIPSKLAEAAFRLWYVLLVPIVLVPAIVLLATRPSTVYGSSASIWVSKPAGIDAGSLSRNASPYLTSAQNQAQVIQDLLQTRSFREAVAAKVAGIDSLDQVVKDVSVTALGPNLLGITARAPSAEQAHALVSAVLGEYQQRAIDESRRESSVVSDYYTQQLAPAQAELAKRQQAVTDYVQQNPRMTDAQRATDPEYLTLTQSVSAQSAVVQSIQDSVQSARLAAVSGPDSEKALFNVIDEPKVPDAPIHVSAAKRYGYPAAGLLAGVVIAAVYLYTIFRTDHTIRSSQDLAGLNMPVVGFVPYLPTPGYGPFGVVPSWVPTRDRRDFARQVAASIATGE